MTTVKELKATPRPQRGKGAARAVRRTGLVPGVIYGNEQPPVSISIYAAELKQRIFAGRFLTTLYDLEIEGTKHRVIPRDFQLDPVRENPVHVDFMRLGEGATIRVRIPIHVINVEQSPGVKRGGTINIVTHSLDVVCPADQIPEFMAASAASPAALILGRPIFGKDGRTDAWARLTIAACAGTAPMSCRALASR